MLFPDLHEQSYGYVNLNSEAMRWLAQRNVSAADPNPLLDPTVGQAFVEETNREIGVGVSYGGWLEDRSVLWRGSYLDAPGTYMHLGVDVNAPVGTRVAFDQEAEVIAVDDDSPLVGGWGNRLVARLREYPIVMIYAHMGKGILCAPGDTLIPGDVIGQLGSSTENGVWFSHVHIQAIRADYFDALTDSEKGDLDGYGREDGRVRLAKLFPDPSRYFSLFGETGL